MWSRLWKPLEWLGALRLPWITLRKPELLIGDPQGVDALGGAGWQAFRKPRALAQVFGPDPDGPWWPFHCLTLFAALDYLKPKGIGPAAADPFPVDAVRMPRWLDPSTLVIVDLPGPETVAVGVALALNGCDLVCTFNNWPHPQGLIRSGDTLAALLRHASRLAVQRRRPEGPAPVAWLCEAGRLGSAPGTPGQFDNRYYIEDSVLPGRDLLERLEVRRIVYLRAEGAPMARDLNEHLKAWRTAGLDVYGARFSPPAIGDLENPSLTNEVFGPSGFLVASGGGFGAPVPHPSSGG